MKSGPVLEEMDLSLIQQLNELGPVIQSQRSVSELDPSHSSFHELRILAPLPFSPCFDALSWRWNVRDESIILDLVIWVHMVAHHVIVAQ